MGDGAEGKVCEVCGEPGSGVYFGAMVCLPCKSFYIRSTKDGTPQFTCVQSGTCEITKALRLRCQACRFNKCLAVGMARKEKPEVMEAQEGQELCAVCGDIANGVHFGQHSCEGCKKFFRRGIKEYEEYECTKEKTCQINPRTRNSCKYCRYQKCLRIGMSRQAIKMGRPKKKKVGQPAVPVTRQPSQESSSSGSEKASASLPELHASLEFSLNAIPESSKGGTESNAVVDTVDALFTLASLESNASSSASPPELLPPTGSVFPQLKRESPSPPPQQPQEKSPRVSSQNGRPTSPETNSMGDVLEGGLEKVVGTAWQGFRSGGSSQDAQNASVSEGFSALRQVTSVPASSHFSALVDPPASTVTAAASRSFNAAGGPAKGDLNVHQYSASASNGLPNGYLASTSRQTASGHAASAIPKVPAHNLLGLQPPRPQASGSLVTGHHTQAHRPLAPAPKAPYPHASVSHPHASVSHPHALGSHVPGLDVPRPQVSGSHAPGSHAPGSHAPGSHVPGSHAPGSHAPGSHAPGSHAPGSHAHGSHAPGSHAPGSHTPGSHAPGSHAPGSHAPGSHAPGSHAPGSHVPGSHALGSHAPGSHAPGSHAPGSHAPGSHAPGSHAPGSHAGPPPGGPPNPMIMFGMSRIHSDNCWQELLGKRHPFTPSKDPSSCKKARLDSSSKAIDYIGVPQNCIFTMPDALEDCAPIDPVLPIKQEAPASHDYIKVSECRTSIDHAYWSDRACVPEAVDKLSNAHNSLFEIMENLLARLLEQTDEMKMVNRERENAATQEINPTKDRYNLIKERIHRNIMALYEFFSALPGHDKLTPEDIHTNCRFGSFAAMIWLSAVKRFDTETKSFKSLWNYPISPHSPVYKFRQVLLRYGQKINECQIDDLELSLIIAMMMICADITTLKEREVAHKIHSIYWIALKACMKRNNKPESHLRNIVSLIVPVRELTAWHELILDWMKFEFNRTEINTIFDPIKQE